MINLFDIVKNDAGATAVFGTNPTRFFIFGEAPQGVAKPFAVCQNISGVPENSLSCPAVVARYTYQIDIYTQSAQESRTASALLRSLFSNYGYVTSIGTEERDAETKLYRCSFDFEIWDSTS